jgi:hypothetical protein
MGDVNGDGEVNITDIAVVATNFGHTEEDYDPQHRKKQQTWTSLFFFTVEIK